MTNRNERATKQLIEMIQHEPLGEPVLSELPSRLVRLLGAEAAAVVAFESSEHEFAIDFLYTTGGFGVGAILDRRVCGRKPFALYDPMRPEPSQRNVTLIVSTASDGALLLEGDTSDARPNAVAADLLREYRIREQLRALVCDGSQLLAWVGAFYEGKVRDPGENKQRLSLLVPHLHRRLRREHALAKIDFLGGALDAALDAIPAPAFLVSQRGVLRYSNYAGRALLAADATLRERIIAVGSGQAEVRGVYQLSVVPIASRCGRHRLVLYASPSPLERRLAAARAAWQLTPRQTAVLERLALGDANKEISTTLGISLRTVEVHVGELMRKAGADSRLRMLSRFWTLGSSP